MSHQCPEGRSPRAKYARRVNYRLGVTGLSTVLVNEAF